MSLFLNADELPTLTIVDVSQWTRGKETRSNPLLESISADSLMSVASHQNYVGHSLSHLKEQNRKSEKWVLEDVLNRYFTSGIWQWAAQIQCSSTHWQIVWVWELRPVLKLLLFTEHFNFHRWPVWILLIRTSNRLRCVTLQARLSLLPKYLHKDFEL